MRMASIWFRLSLVVLALACGGCASLTAGGGNVIGTLRVSGPNVWLNNGPGRDGDQVVIGSSVVTGAGSSAMVEFRGGGYLQIDQNTDPVFGWIEQSKCIVIRILRGQAYLKRERACVEGPDISLVLNSEANILIVPEPALDEVTLIKGSADIAAPGGPIRLLPGQQFALSEGRISSLRVLSKAELKAVTAWRSSYQFRPLQGPQVEAFPPPFRSPHHRRDLPPQPPAGTPGTSDGPSPAPPPTPPPTTPPTTHGIDRGIRVPLENIRKPEPPPEPVIR